MPGSAHPEQYRERLARLSVGQRSDLARRLALAGASSPETQRTERLVACIVSTDGQEIDSDDVREHVRGKLTDYMVPQVVIMQHALPRTAAGKLDRDALQDIVVAVRQETTEEDFAAPANDVEATLANIWANVLGMDEVSTRDNFFEVGGDSLLSIRILAQANRAGLRISPEKFFAHPTIAEQAKIAEPEGTVAAEQGLVTGHAPLIPIQRWFFENVKSNSQQWNQAPLYSLNAPVPRLLLERAVQRLVNHHDALRSRFLTIDGELVQDYSQPLTEPPIDWIELQRGDDESQRAEIATFAEAAHVRFALDQGPLLRFAYFSAPGAARDYLLVIAHHLIIDAVSWRVLIEDLSSLLDCLESGEAAALPRKTTALKEWASRLTELAGTDTFTQQAAYWAGLRDEFKVPLGVSKNLEENRVGTAFTVTKALDASLTSTLVEMVPKVFRTRINDALLAALTTALGNFADAETIRLDLEGHGREPLFDDVDLSRTCGWLTTVYPVVLRTELNESTGNVLESVKKQLRGIPSNGIGHGRLRYLREQRELQNLPKSQILFNYLGRADNSSEEGDRLRLLESNVGQARAPDGQRIYVIEIDCRIQDRCLVVDWTASDRLHPRETIEALAQSYLVALEQIVAAATSGEARVSPSDFPLADLDEGEMASLAAMLEDIDDDS